MPPRRSARVAAVAERACTALAPLPHALLLFVFSLLPVHERAKAALVCRGWRTVLTERSLWTRLDVSPASGVPRALVTEPLLRGAAARSGNQLVSLNVAGFRDSLSDVQLLAVVAANGGTLRELRAGITWGEGMIEGRVAEAILRAAPQLRVLHAGVQCGDVATARRVLLGAPPFGPLRLTQLGMVMHGAAPDELLALASEQLDGLFLAQAPLGTPAALDALADAVHAHGVKSLGLANCDLSPASAPALARLLAGGLHELQVWAYRRTLLHAYAARLLANALRASTTLTSLLLDDIGVWDDPAAAEMLLAALTAHPTLRELSLPCNPCQWTARAAVGRALGALVAANAPALDSLLLMDCDLGDAGLRALVDALPGNTHLRSLNCLGNGMSAAFARTRLLPAVLANSSLRTLGFTEYIYEAEDDEDEPALAVLLEMHALVAARDAA
jgi:hypothetical protein